jgi:electron transfer flavoprotein alpha subunit
MIIAINSDPKAPIFRVAKYGIVGNLFDVIPPIIERAKELNVRLGAKEGI